VGGTANERKSAVGILEVGEEGKTGVERESRVTCRERREVDMWSEDEDSYAPTQIILYVGVAVQVTISRCCSSGIGASFVTWSRRSPWVHSKRRLSSRRRFFGISYTRGSTTSLKASVNQPISLS
jgi:hypothetical protein